MTTKAKFRPPRIMTTMHECLSRDEPFLHGITQPLPYLKTRGLQTQNPQTTNSLSRRPSEFAQPASRARTKELSKSMRFALSGNTFETSKSRTKHTFRPILCTLTQPPHPFCALFCATRFKNHRTARPLQTPTPSGVHSMHCRRTQISQTPGPMITAQKPAALYVGTTNPHLSEDVAAH